MWKMFSEQPTFSQFSIWLVAKSVQLLWSRFCIVVVRKFVNIIIVLFLRDTEYLGIFFQALLQVCKEL